MRPSLFLCCHQVCLPARYKTTDSAACTTQPMRITGRVFHVNLLCPTFVRRHLTIPGELNHLVSICILALTSRLYPCIFLFEAKCSLHSCVTSEKWTLTFVTIIVLWARTKLCEQFCIYVLSVFLFWTVFSWSSLLSLFFLLQRTGSISQQSAALAGGLIMVSATGYCLKLKQEPGRHLLEPVVISRQTSRAFIPCLKWKCCSTCCLTVWIIVLEELVETWGFTNHSFACGTACFVCSFRRQYRSMDWSLETGIIASCGVVWWYTSNSLTVAPVSPTSQPVRGNTLCQSRQ